MPWRKKDEPRSWNGETAGEQRDRGGDDSGDGPKRCNAARGEHTAKVAYGWNHHRVDGKLVRYVKYTCQSCGTDWEEQG